MKIVADENILQVRETFSRWGEVVTLPGRSIGPADIATADVLLVRSVTRVDGALLTNSPVKFVGTATIGLDHVDQDYLHQRGIHLAAAPGCNAGAVVQYVFSVMAHLQPEWRQAVIGIIGCGNVGGRLDRQLTALGVETRCYDPFLSTADNPRLTTLPEVLAADIICLHTPLTRTGPYPSWHLIGARELAVLRPGTLLINAGRGEALDNQALTAAIDARQLSVALDVWEGEPDISRALLAKVKIATPHIAGYSRDGKLMGTQMVQQAFCEWAGLPMPEADSKDSRPTPIEAKTLSEAILQAYDVMVDDQKLREAMQQEEAAVAFDWLRKHYPQRLEFQHFCVTGEVPESLRRELKVLGFA